jgi:hypothetical protein
MQRFFFRAYWNTSTRLELGSSPYQHGQHTV